MSTLAERIDCLFRSHAAPRSREYSYRNAASALSGQNGLAFSPTYLWQLRTGVKDNPTMRHIEALARFFGVSPSYFFDDELTELPDSEVRLLATSQGDTLRPIAMNLLGLSEGSLQAVLRLTCHLRHLEGKSVPTVARVTKGPDDDSNPAP